MSRPSLLQNPTRPETGRPEARTSSPELAAWLTSDLRVKGAPSTPPAAEVPPPAPSVRVVAEPNRDAEQSAFSAWLTSDLRPRKSHPPPDSLAPQVVVTPSPVEVPEEVAPPRADLEADDLAVLPGRSRGKAGATGRRLRTAAVLAALLFMAGSLLFRAGGPAPEPIEPSVAAQPRAALGALPPPPPTDVPPPAVPEAEAEPAPVSRGPRQAAPEEPPPELEDDPWSGPRGRNWARYADLPSPTLSRLAREERELAKQRDEQRRVEAKRAKRAE